MGKGFCQWCQEDVVDFTYWSDNEILRFFENNQQKVCGRFRTDQMKTYEQKKEPFLTSKVKQYIVGGVLSLVSSTAAGQSEEKVLVEQVSLVNPAVEDSSFLQFNGKVMDVFSFPVGDAMWTLSSTMNS